MGRGSSSNRLSRPARTLCTRPARCSTRRCLVIACRVSREPTVNCEIAAGSPAQAFATSASLVSSASAANSTACAGRRACARLRLLRDIVLDVLHLLCPAAVVTAHRITAPFGGDLFESRLGNHKQRASRGLLQA